MNEKAPEIGKSKPVSGVLICTAKYLCEASFENVFTVSSYSNVRGNSVQLHPSVSYFFVIFQFQPQQIDRSQQRIRRHEVGQLVLAAKRGASCGTVLASAKPDGV